MPNGTHVRGARRARTTPFAATGLTLDEVEGPRFQRIARIRERLAEGPWGSTFGSWRPRLAEPPIG